jgi:hypothetical protein
MRPLRRRDHVHTPYPGGCGDDDDDDDDDDRHHIGTNGNAIKCSNGREFHRSSILVT